MTANGNDWWTYGTRRRRANGSAPNGAVPAGPALRGALASNIGVVKGEGTGRSDDIPALLSDGEHIITAEDVSLLGDGSNDAGHERLEEMKISLRKHKGGALSKGDISPDAKAPLEYMRRK